CSGFSFFCLSILIFICLLLLVCCLRCGCAWHRFLSQFIRSEAAPLLVHSGYFPARSAGKWCWSQRRSLCCSQLLTRNVSSRLLTGEKRKAFRKVKILLDHHNLLP